MLTGEEKKRSLLLAVLLEMLVGGAVQRPCLQMAFLIIVVRTSELEGTP